MMNKSSQTKNPQTMRHIIFKGVGGPDVIHLAETSIPVPGRGQVLIEVAAYGVNRPDCIQRAGSYPPPPGESAIPGLEAAGRVAALGEGVEQFKLGDEVCALLGSGGYADYAIAAAELCLPIPKSLSMIEAAGVPETFFTVFDNVFIRGQLKPKEIFLTHGGSSGIGSTAIQLAKQFGATVIATAGTEEKCAFCRKIGADLAINYRTADFVQETRAYTQKRGVNVILDMVGGDYTMKNISCLGVDGRLVQIGFLGGSTAPDFNYLPVMLRRLTLTGSTLRPRSVAQKEEIAQRLRADIWPLLESGAIKPEIFSVFPMEKTREAHELMESSKHLGKIIITTGR